MIQTSRWLAFALAILLVLPGASVFAQQITVQHNMPITHPWHQAMELIGDVVKQETGGAASFQIYPHGILAQGNWALILEQTQAGATNITLESSIPFATLVPELFALNLPFLFDGVDHYKRFISNPPEVVQRWFNKLEDHDLVVIGWFTRPFRQLINSVRPIRTPEDIEGLRFRVPGLDLFIQTFELFGAKPVALPAAEIYTALQLGTIVGEDNSVVTVYEFRTHEVTKYMTIWDYMADGVLVVANKNSWNRLPENVRAAIQKGINEARDKVYALDNELTETYIQRMKDTGIEFYFMSDEEKEPWRELVRPTYDKMRALIGDKDFDAFLAAVDAAR